MKYELIKTRFREGTWEGLLTVTNGAPVPELSATWRDVSLDDVSVEETPTSGRYLVQVPVPKEAIGDGVQTFVIHPKGKDRALASFTLISGEAVGDDLRAEVELLRAELDMLKRAFRQHCSET